MDTATHTDETGLVIEYEQQQSMDIQLPVAVNIILLVTWLLLCGAGLAVILLQKNFWAGLFIIGVPTILGMIVKPTFALVLVMLILPTGAGVGYAQSFSLDRGIGIALALSFLLNIMVTRPRLHLSHKVLWVILLYSFWIFLSPLGSPHPFVELRRVFTQFQLVAFALIIYWILERNGEYSLRWVLRSYVLGTLGMIAITFFTGAAITSIEETSQERYTATVGGMIDANALAAIVALAFLSAVYLIVRDKNLLWRLMYCTALLILPVMLLKIGSRGALIALAFTLMSPLLFIRQVSQKPTLVLALLMVIVLASLAVGLARSRQMLTEGVEQRLTDVHYAKKSIDYRIGLMKACVNSAINRPVLGSSHAGWLERSGMISVPHSDFFFVLGIYGIPCVLSFALFIFLMMLTVKHIPLGVEKLYARAILIFLLVMGLNITQVYKKYFWFFLIVVLAIERFSANFHSQEQQQAQSCCDLEE